MSEDGEEYCNILEEDIDKLLENIGTTRANVKFDDISCAASEEVQTKENSETSCVVGQAGTRSLRGFSAYDFAEVKVEGYNEEIRDTVKSKASFYFSFVGPVAKHPSDDGRSGRDIRLCGEIDSREIRYPRRVGCIALKKQALEEVNDTLNPTSDSAVDSKRDPSWQPSLKLKLREADFRRTRARHESSAASKRANRLPTRQSPRKTIEDSKGQVFDGVFPVVNDLKKLKEQPVSCNMGNQKEFFEAWSKPRTRGRPRKKANVEEDLQNKDSNIGGKENSKKPAAESSKPRGMKKSNASNRKHANSDLLGERRIAGDGGTRKKGGLLKAVLESARGPASKRISEEQHVTKEVTGRKACTAPPPSLHVDQAAEHCVAESSVEREKGSPAYQNKKTASGSKESDPSVSHMPPEISTRSSPQKQKKMKSIQLSEDSSEPSYSERGRDRRRRSCDSYSSQSPERNRRGRRELRYRKRRRSYSVSEEEEYRRVGYDDRRQSTHYEDYRHHKRDEAECSKRGRRRRSRRSDSENENAEKYNRKERTVESDSEDGRRSCPERMELSAKAKNPTANNETAKRRDRRHRQREREDRKMQRERQGLKGHYIAVDEHGEPYSYGVAAWRLELNKLCASLDPSVMDIRWQPEESMKLLRKRLKENFEYSAPISRAYIRSLAGRNVTQRRNKIMNSMRENAPCPAGMDDKVWRRLDRIRQNPRREELSQRMKYANACRRNVGRTGPKGLSGVREDLRLKLGREPDPDEVEEDMHRDKGYGGRRKKKEVVAPDVTSESDSEERALESTGPPPKNAEEPGQLTWKNEEKMERNGSERPVRDEYILSLEKQIEELTAKKKATEMAGGSIAFDTSSPSGSRTNGIEQGEVGTKNAKEKKLGSGDGSGGIGKATSIRSDGSPKKRKSKSRKH